MKGRGRGASRINKVVVPGMTPTRNSRRPAPGSGTNLRPMVTLTSRTTPRNDTPAGGSAKATISSSDGRGNPQLSFNLMANTASTASGGGRVATRAVPTRVATPAVAVPTRVATPAVPRRIATPAPAKRGSVAQPTSVISGGRPIATTRTNDTVGPGRSTSQTAFRRTTVNSIAAGIPGEAGGLVATPGVVTGTKRLVKNEGNVPSPSKKAKIATQGRTDEVGQGPSAANNQPGPGHGYDGSTHTEPQPSMATGKRARGSVASSAQRAPAPPPKSLTEIMAMPTSTSDTNNEGDRSQIETVSSDDDDVVTVTASAPARIQGQGQGNNSTQELVGYDQNQMMQPWDYNGRMMGNSPMTMIYNAWGMPMGMGMPPMFGMGMMPYPYGFGFGGMYGMPPGTQLIPPSASMFVHRGMMNPSVGNGNGMWSGSGPGFGQGSPYGNMGHMGMGMGMPQLPSPQNPGRGRHSGQH